MVRKHIANEHNETMPPSMYEYFHGAIWQRKNSHNLAVHTTRMMGDDLIRPNHTYH